MSSLLINLVYDIEGKENMGSYFWMCWKAILTTLNVEMGFQTLACYFPAEKLLSINDGT